MPIQKAGSLFGAYAPAAIISPVLRCFGYGLRGGGLGGVFSVRLPHTPLLRGVGCIIAPRPQRRDGAFGVSSHPRRRRFAVKALLQSRLRSILTELLRRAGGISPGGVHNPSSMKCGLRAVRGALTKSPVDKAHVRHIVLALVAALAAGTGCHAVNCHGKPITAFIVSANGPGPRKQPRGAGNYRHGRSGRKGKDF